MERGNKDVTEERILKAAFDVIDQKTISGTRMHLIAEKAGMVQSNLHYYFKTKKDLLMALLRYIQHNFTEDRERELQRHESSLHGQLEGFFAQKKQILLEAQKYDRAQFDYWCQGQVDPDINACFQETMEIWRGRIEETILLYKPTIDPQKSKMAAIIMVSMMMGASMQYLNDPHCLDLERYFADCEQMVEQFLAEH